MVDKAKPKPITLIPIKDRKREVLIDLITEWRLPYPDGLGDDVVNELVEELITSRDKGFDTMAYTDFMLLFHVIEERYRQTRRRKMLAEQEAVE